MIGIDEVCVYGDCMGVWIDMGVDGGYFVVECVVGIGYVGGVDFVVGG